MKTPEQMAEDILHGVGKVASELWGDDEQAKKFAEVIRGTWLAGYQAAERQWISVKDRLPETNQLCLVNTEWRGVVPATYGNESWIFDDGQGWLEKALSYATHWMPLPEPPKEEK